VFYRLRTKSGGPGPFAEWERCVHDLDSPVAQHNLTYDVFPDFEPEFQPVLLSRKSSLVDFIDGFGVVGGQGLLVSEKALGILEAMKLPPYQTYPLEVVHKDKSVARPRYSWMQILLIDNYRWIDFAASEFTIQSRFDFSESKGEPVTIESEAALNGLIQRSDSEDYSILFTKLALNDAYASSPLDLFYMDRLNGPISRVPIISHELKVALEAEAVTGYELNELPIVIARGS
jgi:hypothetical protein